VTRSPPDHLAPFRLLRPSLPPDACPVCGRQHAADQPHDATALLYQYTYYASHGSWPTWQHAMAHCAPAVQQQWTQALLSRGVDVAAGQIYPPDVLEPDPDPDADPDCDAQPPPPESPGP